MVSSSAVSAVMVGAPLAAAPRRPRISLALSLGIGPSVQRIVKFSAVKAYVTCRYVPGEGQVRRPLSDWLPLVPRRLGRTRNAPERAPPELPPYPAGRLAKPLRGRAAGRRSAPGETSAS